MKKKYILTLLIIFVAVFPSCNRILDVKPTNIISPDNYYSSEQEATNALLGLYTVFSDNGPGLYASAALTTFVIPTDELYRNTTTGPNTLLIDPTTTSSYWAECYLGINNCNSFLENINKAPLTDAKKAVYRGEALFMRAYIYFLLVSQFGDVPLKLTSTQSVYNLNVAFTPAKTIYEKIITDMTAAEGMVNDVDPASQQPTRVSKQVVRGILSRVCLYMAGYPILDASKYSMARDWAKKVVDANQNSLNPDYTQIWINIAKDAYDLKESMWEAEFQAPQAPYYRAAGWGGQTGIGIACPSTNTLVGYVLDWYKVTYSLSELYNTDPADLRKDWNIASFYYADNTTNQTSRDLNLTPLQVIQRVTIKNPGKLRRIYETVRPSSGVSGMNFPILRYADVLLMYAEAENEINGPDATAINLINQVRSRAKCTKLYSTSSTDPNFLITDQASFRKAIQDERSRELCFEYVRRNDLIRWGIYIDKMKAEATKGQTYVTAPYPAWTSGNPATTISLIYNRIGSRNTTLPIPVTEISLNNLATQNPGW